MTAHLAFDRISELADSRDQHAESREPHLRECAECRETLRRVRELVSAAQTLPREVQPPPEVWSALRARVAKARTRRPWRVVSLLAAAGIVFLLASVGILLRGASQKVKGKGPPPPAQLVAVDMSYILTVDELHKTLEHQKLPASTAVALNRSLQVVDTAIDEARRAMMHDPNNAALADILASNYQRKLELLQRAADLSTSF